jgi:hypothetical protein
MKLMVHIGRYYVNGNDVIWDSACRISCTLPSDSSCRICRICLATQSLYHEACLPFGHDALKRMPSNRLNLSLIAMFALSLSVSLSLSLILGLSAVRI